MNEKLLPIYSEASNATVVQTPGQPFPGIVVQGDSLHALAELAQFVEGWIQSSAAPADIILAMAELAAGLTGRVHHYDSVLQQHGLQLPDSAPGYLQGSAAFRFGLVVLRCADIDKSHAFYSALGLRFDREQHGSGPPHYAASSGSTVLELYPARPGSPGTAGLRLGLYLRANASAVRNALAIGGSLISTETLEPGATGATISDPDAHTLVLDFLG